MTAKQFRDALEHIGLTQVAAAKLLGVSVRSVHGWAKNEQRVPVAVSIVLRLMIEFGLKPEDIDED